MYTTIGIIILCYLFLVVGIFFYQRNLLYHPFENNYSTDLANFPYEEVSIPVSNEINLKGWFHIKDLNNKKTLVFFSWKCGQFRKQDLQT